MPGAGSSAALALAASPAAAFDDSLVTGGVWAGTLGETPITVCLNEEYTKDGLYYAKALLEPIRLQPLDEVAPRVLTEIAGRDEATGAVWTLESPANGTLAGEWRQGVTMLPIRLTAVAAEIPMYGAACEAPAFFEPLLAGGAVTATPARLGARLGGTAYTALTYTGPKRAGLDGYQVTSFALEPEQPGDPAINHALAEALPDGTAVHRMGQCAGLAFGRGIGGYTEEALVPILIAPRWLGIRHSGSSFCGGAHPNHFSVFAIHERDSGAKVDPATWFKPGALGFYDWEPEPGQSRPIAGLSKALARAVLAHWPAQEDATECGLPEALSGISWDIGLTREGPVFVPQLPHVMFACTEEVAVPWKQARPFLSAEGRAVMDSLR